MLKKIGSMLALSLFAAILALPLPARALDISLDGFLRGLCGTATASGGAATLANKCGVVTSESLTTPDGSTYTLTLTNTTVAAADIVLFSVSNGSNTGGAPIPQRGQPASGSVVFTVKNVTGGANGVGAAFNGTVQVRYFVIKP